MNKTLSIQSMPCRQRGAMTLLISLVILTLITFISLYTARTVSMEQKIAGNEFRSRQAFEAADAGLESALAYVNPNNGGPDRDSDSVLDVNVFCDTSGSGTCAANADGGPVPADVDPGAQGTQSMTLANGSTVNVTITDISSDSDMTQILVNSVGTSSDGTATRAISLIVPTITPLPNVPDNPLTTRGSIVIGGSATVYNTEGHSTIWSGDDVDLGQNAATATMIANPGDPDGNYPACLGGESAACQPIQTSDKDTEGLDVIEEDSSLANLTGDQFFENFFGMSPTAYKNSFDVTEVAAADIADVDHKVGGIIWVDGDVTTDGDYGCAVDISPRTGATKYKIADEPCSDANRGPVIMIIDGDMDIQGGNFLGLVFVTGTVSYSGGPFFEGALAVGGNGGTSSSSGSMSVWYNSSYLRATNPDGPKAGAAGTWRDF